MNITQYFAENKFKISYKGMKCLIQAFRKHFPSLESVEEWTIKSYIWNADLKEEDCFQILELTIRYAKLWAFS